MQTILTKLEFKLFHFLCKIDNTFSQACSQKILLNILVSGGQDSMGLLHAVHTVINSKIFKTKNSFTAIVTHFNHKKRGMESDEDAYLAMQTCLNLGIECFCFDIPPSEKKENFQNYARMKRHQMALDLCQYFQRTQNFDRFFVCTAHHAQDHVESVLLHLIRGSGIIGLQGFYSEGQSHFLKPLSEVSVDQIREYVEHKQIPFRVDSSNLSDIYARNFVRHQILPQFKKINVHYTKSFLRVSKQLKALTDANKIQLTNQEFVFLPTTTSFEFYNYLKLNHVDIANDLSESAVENIFHEVHLFRKSKKENLKKLSLKNNKTLILYKRNQNEIHASL